ncbi:MAG: lauroyl-Kdo(2)-lipid IV(A) myristoyltransferase [Psychrobium sp.]|nr:lauroyl-Kdo(2)-lipid IV(A) myristoyltransferase [Psychrobium sp.]
MNCSDKYLFRTPFEWRWLHPKYIGTWLAVLLLFFCAFTPAFIRDRFARSLASLLIKFAKKPVRIINTNLSKCFTHLDQAQRNVIIKQNIEVFLQIILGQGELVFRSTKHIERRFDVDGWHHLQAVLDAKQPVIFLTPHLWGLEYAGTYFRCRKVPLLCFVNKHKNPIYNWLAVKQRSRFCSNVYVREGGVRVMLKGLKEGKHLFYLPDEDHGEEKSVFAPLFDCDKATLPVLNRLACASQAKILPMSIAYNQTEHRFKITIDAPCNSEDKLDKEAEARFLNQQIERLILKDLSQYMWILRILKTRPEGEERFY